MPLHGFKAKCPVNQSITVRPTNKNFNVYICSLTQNSLQLLCGNVHWYVLSKRNF